MLVNIRDNGYNRVSDFVKKSGVILTQQHKTHNNRYLITPNLLTRLISSAILIPIVLYCIYLGGIAFTALSTFLSIIAALEFSMMITGRQWTVSVIVSLFITPLLTLTIGYGSFAMWLVVTVFGSAVILILEYSAMQRPPRDRYVMVLLMLYAAHSIGFGILIRAHEAGLFLWLLVLAGAWGTDTLSYAGGRLYGKHPLAPRLSPNKTIEGALTGVIGAIILGMILIIQADAVIPLTIVLITKAPLAAVVGDLLESAIKRRYHIKDSGVPGFNVFPGHGGMLDRTDSVMMVILVLYPLLLLIT